MEDSVLVIGAGLSGLTAAALLAKRGLPVTVVEKASHPGGTCGAFKRRDAVFDQGSAMLFGFGETGFNPHRFVFNALEQPIDVIRHPSMYAMQFGDKRIVFDTDMDSFVERLGEIFPTERESLRRFYADLARLYAEVIETNPPLTTPDESDKKQYAEAVKQYPLSYIKFLSFMFRDVHSLLKKYFRDPAVFQFFDKLTSTYCYTPARETPAVLGAVMFVENHKGGSFYPAGSTLFLPGKLEKSIEDNGGQMVMNAEADRIIFEGGKPAGVHLTDGRTLRARYIIYSGTVWNLYGRLLAPERTPVKKRQWAKNLEPTLPNVVVYLRVKADVIPPGTLAVEMLAEDTAKLNDQELTVYINSLDDATLCGEGSHLVTAVGPSYESWRGLSPARYATQKQAVLARVLATLERRFPGISGAVQYATVATPRTMEQYTLKNGGAAAGPKQKMGQHMLKRLHTRTEWDSLYCCGESTVMGTGTPAVTISGIAAANAVLRATQRPEYRHDPAMQNYVTTHGAGYSEKDMYTGQSEAAASLMRAAAKCQYCKSPRCTASYPWLDMPGILRRLAVENLHGAARLAKSCGELHAADFAAMQQACVRGQWAQPVQIASILPALLEMAGNRETSA